MSRFSCSPQSIFEISGWIAFRSAGHDCETEYLANAVCTENLIRVNAVMESPNLAE
jgi:hypothetical protein